MASYTSFLNLEKPTTSERLDVLKINSNWDKIDAGVSALNSQLSAKFSETRKTSMNDLLSYISTQKIGITRVDSTVGALLGNYSRQGICLCCEISSEYDSYIFLDSNGDTYSGWITIATGAVTKNKL